MEQHMGSISWTSPPSLAPGAASNSNAAALPAPPSMNTPHRASTLPMRAASTAALKCTVRSASLRLPSRYFKTASLPNKPPPCAADCSPPRPPGRRWPSPPHRPRRDVDLVVRSASADARRRRGWWTSPSPLAYHSWWWPPNRPTARPRGCGSCALLSLAVQSTNKSHNGTLPFWVMCSRSRFCAGGQVRGVEQRSDHQVAARHDRLDKVRALHRQARPDLRMLREAHLGQDRLLPQVRDEQPGQKRHRLRSDR